MPRRWIALLGAHWTRLRDKQRNEEAVSGAQDWINTIVSGLSLVATAVIARVAYNKTREANETAKRSLGEAKRAADAAAETASIERARYVESRTARLRVDDVRVVNEHPVGASPWSDALVIDVENIGRATAYAVHGVLSCAGQSIPSDGQGEVSPRGRRQLRFGTRPIPVQPGGCRNASRSASTCITATIMPRTSW